MGQQAAASIGLITGKRSSSGAHATGQAHHASLQWIPAQVRRLADRGADCGQTWSLAEVCEHLALAIESTIRGSGDEGPPRRWETLTRFERMKRWCIKRVMLATGWFPHGVSAPESVVPSGTVSLHDALSRLETAAADFDRKCSSPASTWSYHSLLGRMSGRAWRRFHSIHARHHFSFFTPGQRF